MAHTSSTGLMRDKFRMAALITTLLLLVPAVAVAAPTAEAPASRSPAAAEKRTFSMEESRALGEAAQRRDEARQQVWDRKMKAISKGICVGC